MFLRRPTNWFFVATKPVSHVACKCFAPDSSARIVRSPYRGRQRQRNRGGVAHEFGKSHRLRRHLEGRPKNYENILENDLRTRPKRVYSRRFLQPPEAVMHPSEGDGSAFDAMDPETPRNDSTKYIPLQQLVAVRVMAAIMIYCGFECNRDGKPARLGLPRGSGTIKFERNLGVRVRRFGRGHSRSCHGHPMSPLWLPIPPSCERGACHLSSAGEGRFGRQNYFRNTQSVHTLWCNGSPFSFRDSFPTQPPLGP